MTAPSADDKRPPRTVTELAQEIAPGRTIGEAIDSDFNKCSYRTVCRLMKQRLTSLPSPIAAHSDDPIIEAHQQAREDDVWDDVIKACAQAWPGERPSYLQSPIELIVQIINERDEALARPSATLAPQDDPFCWYRVTRDITDEYVTVYSEAENCPGPDWKPLYEARSDDTTSKP